MELTENEARALSTEIRNYAEMRGDIGDLGEDLREVQAELNDDPTYANSGSAIDSALDRTVERYEAARENAQSVGSPFRELASDVTSTHRLDLNNPETMRLVTDVIDNTGWEVGRDRFNEPPAQMRQVVQAIQTRQLINTSFGAAASKATQPRPSPTAPTRPTASTHTNRGTGIGE